MKTRKNITICPIVWAELKRQAQKSSHSISALIELKAKQPLMQDLVWLGAFEYWCGRRTIAVGSFVDTLIESWPHLSERVRNAIQRDLERYFVMDTACRESGDGMRYLGDDCDRALWEQVRKLWQAESLNEEAARKYLAEVKK